MQSSLWHLTGQLCAPTNLP